MTIDERIAMERGKDTTVIEAGKQNTSTQEAGKQSTSPQPLLASHGVYGEGTLAKRSSDLHMALRAVRQKWPIPEDKREWLVSVLLDGAANATDWRDRIASVRGLISMEAQNMAAAGEGQVNSPVSTHIRNLIIQVGKGTDLPSLPADVVHTNQE